MSYSFKSFQAILRDMIAKFLAETPVNDINAGSVITTFMEASAQEIAQNYFQQYQNIRSTNLDNCRGDEVDTYAAGISSSLTRLPSSKATSSVVITDPAITKVSTTIYSGTRGPAAGQLYVDLNDSTGFTSTGDIIIGRSNDNAETVPYTAITSIPPYFRFTLGSALVNDHGSDETVILSQGGDRPIPINTVVYVPASDVSDKIQFVTTSSATILDGESESDLINIEATISGSDSNISAGAINSFESNPFTGATVTNPYKITNGRDIESDDDFKDRIKLYIQGISLGTLKSLIYSLIGLTSDDDNKNITSAKVREPITLEDDPIVYAYIDDGSGLEPSFAGIGVEEVLTDTTGGEQFLQISNFPIQKANIESIASQPFDLSGGETLIVEIDGEQETITFNANSFSVLGFASAQEVAEAINDLSELFEARTSNNGEKVVISAITNTNEKIQVIGGTANTELQFDTKLIDTIDLYKFDGENLTKLTKDGQLAYVESTTAPFNFSGGEVLNIIVDGKTANPQTITFLSSDFVAPASATVDEVIERINSELSGATAESHNNKVKIVSNKGKSSEASVQVTGGTANAILAFSTTEVVGEDKDYILNRYNGQIELLNTVSSGEDYTIGSEETRAFFISSSVEPFTLSDGDTFTIDVDGGATQTATFLNTDFTNIAAATAQEICDVLNSDLVGIYAEDYNGAIKIRTNSWDDTYSSLLINSDSDLGFELGTTKTSFPPHCGFSISTDDTPAYSLSEDDNLVVIIDGAESGQTFNITTQIAGIVTTGDAVADYDTFIADISALSLNFNSTFDSDNDLVDFDIYWTSGSNISTTSSVASYDASNGRFTLAATAGSAIAIGDEFIILPTTAKNVVTILNSSLTSSLNDVADISLANNGTCVQISSLTFGSDSSVQVTGGTANDELEFDTDLFAGKNGYSYYTGIIKEAQSTINGLDSDLSNYPGVSACGVQVEVLTPIIKTVTVSYTLTYREGFSESFVNSKVKSLIISYINSLKIGDDLYVNDLVNIIKEVDGIKNVEIILPTDTIAASDREVIRTTIDRVFIS